MKTVLLVEDLQYFQDDVARALGSRGIAVRVASNETIAMELIRKEPFDAVIADVDLSKGGGTAEGGFLLFEWMKREKISTPVILTSCYMPAEITNRAVLKGFFRIVGRMNLDYLERLAATVLEALKTAIDPAPDSPYHIHQIARYCWEFGFIDDDGKSDKGRVPVAHEARGFGAIVLILQRYLKNKPDPGPISSEEIWRDTRGTPVLPLAIPGQDAIQAGLSPVPRPRGGRFEGYKDDELRTALATYKKQEDEFYAQSPDGRRERSTKGEFLDQEIKRLEGELKRRAEHGEIHDQGSKNSHQTRISVNLREAYQALKDAKLEKLASHLEKFITPDGHYGFVYSPNREVQWDLQLLPPGPGKSSND